MNNCTCHMRIWGPVNCPRHGKKLAGSGLGATACFAAADEAICRRIDEIKLRHYGEIEDAAYLLLQAAKEAQATGQVPDWLLNTGRAMERTESIGKQNDRVMAPPTGDTKNL